MWRRRFPSASALALCALALAAGASRANAVSVTEYPLPVDNGTPLGIAAGADGNVWFTEIVGSRFGRVTPAGKVTDFSTGSGISTGSEPWSIAAGPDGNLWFAEQAGNRVGRIVPSLASATEFSNGIGPQAGIRGITGGPDGNVWFTEDGGNRIGRITPAGVVTEMSAGVSPGARPQAIASGPDGNLWFTEMSGNRIGRITPAGVVLEFSAGITPNSLPVGIVAGPDANLWFTELQGNRIGRITTAGVVTEFTVPGGNGSLRDIIAGPDGNLWFTDESIGRIGRITPAGAVTMYPLTLARNGRPLEITSAPGRDLWFTTGSGNHVARLRLDPAVTTGPTSAVTPSSAQVTGTVDPFGSATSYVVQYGRTTAYGSTTPSRVIPAGPGPVPVSVALPGLASGTLYHYRLVASSAGGTTAGADRTLMTTGTPGRPGVSPTGRDTVGPRMRIRGRALVLAGGRVRLTLSCPLAETLGCRGSVRLEAPGRHRVRLGISRFRIGGGQTRTVAIRLTPGARAHLRARRALRVAAIVAAVDAAGNRATTVRRLTLRAS